MSNKCPTNVQLRRNILRIIIAAPTYLLSRSARNLRPPSEKREKAQSKVIQQLFRIQIITYHIPIHINVNHIKWMNPIKIIDIYPIISILQYKYHTFFKIISLSLLDNPAPSVIIYSGKVRDIDKPVTDSTLARLYPEPNSTLVS